MFAVAKIANDNPNAFNKNDKEQVKSIIKIMIGIEESDSLYYASVGE